MNVETPEPMTMPSVPPIIFPKPELLMPPEKVEVFSTKMPPSRAAIVPELLMPPEKVEPPSRIMGMPPTPVDDIVPELLMPPEKGDV